MADEVDLPHLTKKRVAKLLDACRITDGRKFKLRNYDPADTYGIKPSKPEAAAMLATGVAKLADLQEKLAAQDRWSLLCVFQAMDAGGKDGTIKRVMSGVNPAGIQVTSFKAPGPEELEHDFLWRINRALPRRGQIGIFNRSHYEEVLAVRVHPATLERQHLPPELAGRKVWQHRLEDIAAWERYLARQGVIVLKFFLHISPEEQRRRFLERLDAPDKFWKFSLSDMAERAYWNDYRSAFESAIAATSTPHAPWFVVPADTKWFAHLVVIAAMVEALDKLDLRLPDPTPEMREAMEKAREKLKAED